MVVDETKRTVAVTRRRFLAVIAGVAASAALAACGSSNATDTPKADTSPTTAAGQPTTAAGQPTTAAGQPTTAPATTSKAGNKEFHSAWPYEVPPTGNFNMIQGVSHTIMNPPNIYGDLIVQPFAMYYWKDDKWLPLMATDWKFVGGDTFSVTLRKGAKWSDGKDFTSKDVLSTFWCMRLMSHSVWKYVDKIDAPDASTVNFHMKQPSTVVQRYVLRTNTMSDVTYGPWAKRVQDLFNGGKSVSDPEGKQLLQEFTNFKPDDVIASGPFKFDTKSITNAQMTLPKNTMAWNADQVLFDKIVNYNGETPDVSPLVLSKEIDYATHGFPPSTEQAMQQAGVRVLRPPVYNGGAIFINFDKLGNILGDKKVRQALAYAIDRDQNAKVTYADSGKGVKYMTGMSDILVPKWMPDADVKALNLYPYDPAKAASMLTDLGWKKGGDGVWATKDGTRAEFEMLTPAEYVDSSTSAQNAAEQLTKFGFKTTVRAITYTQFPVDLDKGNFQLALSGWGASTNPHPFFSYDNNLFLHNTRALNNGGKGMAFSLKQKTDVAGDVDLEKLTLDSADGLDEGAQKSNVATIAKVSNELLPIIPLYERYGNNAALEKVRVQAWPPDDDPILQNAPYADGIVTMLMLTGRLKPV
ncbi:MAG: ABC transporter substrate-binding protein [Thermomicrobiales bacterium]